MFCLLMVRDLALNAIEKQSVAQPALFVSYQNSLRSPHPAHPFMKFWSLNISILPLLRKLDVLVIELQTY